MFSNAAFVHSVEAKNFWYENKSIGYSGNF